MPTFEVSVDRLKKEAGEFDLEGIRLLSLAKRGVSSAGVAEIAALCPNLTDLDLSGNGLDSADGLKGLAQLQKLRLNENKIRSLGFVSELPGLQQLFLQGNLVDHMREITAMRPPGHVSGLGKESDLRVLYLRNVDGSDANPVTEHLAYRTSVVRQLSSLTNLDGERTHLEEEHSTIKAAVPEAELPPSTIPDYEPWIAPDVFENVLTPPSGVAAAHVSVFESTLAESKQLQDSAQVIIDRYQGFANVIGKAG